MPFSRGRSCGQDPCQGPSGGGCGLKNRIFHPHDSTKTLNIIGVGVLEKRVPARRSDERTVDFYRAQMGTPG